MVVEWVSVPRTETLPALPKYIHPHQWSLDQYAVAIDFFKLLRTESKVEGLYALATKDRLELIYALDSQDPSVWENVGEKISQFQDQFVDESVICSPHLVRRNGNDEIVPLSTALRRDTARNLVTIFKRSENMTSVSQRI